MRRVERGSCGDPYGTACQHDPACLRCQMLSVNPKIYASRFQVGAGSHGQLAAYGSWVRQAVCDSEAAMRPRGPGTCGSGTTSWPRQACQSDRQIPVALTSITTPARGHSGLGTLATRSGEPPTSKTTRRSAPILQRVARRASRPGTTTRTAISSPKSSASSCLSAWRPIQKEVRPTGDDVGPDLAVTRDRLRGGTTLTFRGGAVTLGERLRSQPGLE